jgi:hypothetical protein
MVFALHYSKSLVQTCKACFPSSGESNDLLRNSMCFVSSISVVEHFHRELNLVV